MQHTVEPGEALNLLSEIARWPLQSTGRPGTALSFKVDDRTEVGVTTRLFDLIVWESDPDDPQWQRRYWTVDDPSRAIALLAEWASRNFDPAGPDPMLYRDEHVRRS